MTIDPLFLDESFSIAYPEHFYAADIEVSHHQLRNFISTFYHGKIFYVNKHDIYVLDLETRERSLLVTVQFEARCLAAAHGWVCVGGETKGDCAFIHISENDGQPGDFCLDLDYKMLGKEIVNAMNIQILKPEPTDDQARDEIVVLISNNDHTVTVYSLSQQVVLTTIDHPQPMNYAALSPDSNIMATVGDENKVYFFKRSLVQNSPESESDAFCFPEYEWRPLAVPDLPRGIQQKEDFSFAIAFSPNGHLCAVSSQGGAITIFDMELINEEIQPPEDAIICTFRSSRESLWGCVRSMAFSPARWDLLAWTEDHGRIGLADLKQGFQRRQHLHLSKDKCKEIDIDDLTPPDLKLLGYKERILLQQQQRMQTLRGHPPVGARSLSNDRDPPNTLSSVIQRETDHLSERERSVNRALGTTLGESVGRPYSVNYVSSQPETRPSASSIGLRREYDVQLINPGSRFVPSHIPRRRPSVILSDPSTTQRLVVDESSRMTMTASPGPISDDGMPPPMSTNDLTPATGSASSQPLPYNIPPSDPWHVIEANLASRRIEGGPSTRQQVGLQQLDNAIHRERQLELHMNRQLSHEEGLYSMLQSALNLREQEEQLRQLERQHESQSNQSENSRLSPRTERVSVRQLSQDLDECLIRMRQLVDLTRNMPRRINQLEDERSLLLQQQRSPSRRSSLTSARSSALPTIFARADLSEMERRLQRAEEERQYITQRIEGMEREVRRAENVIEAVSSSTSVVPQSVRDRLRNRTTSRDHPALIITHLLSDSQNGSPIPSSGGGPNIRLARPAGSLPEHYVSASSYRRIEQRHSASRTSEPEIRITPANVHSARLWMHGNNADVNGNWRMAVTSLAGDESSRTTAVEQALREAGIGTAGVGWSPDGLKLYAGSEYGIFEYKLNIQDRLQCPLIELC